MASTSSFLEPLEPFEVKERPKLLDNDNILHYRLKKVPSLNELVNLGELEDVMSLLWISDQCCIASCKTRVDCQLLKDVAVLTVIIEFADRSAWWHHSEVPLIATAQGLQRGLDFILNLFVQKRKVTGLSFYGCVQTRTVFNSDSTTLRRFLCQHTGLHLTIENCDLRASVCKEIVRGAKLSVESCHFGDEGKELVDCLLS